MGDLFGICYHCFGGVSPIKGMFLPTLQVRPAARPQPHATCLCVICSNMYFVSYETKKLRFLARPGAGGDEASMACAGSLLSVTGWQALGRPAFKLCQTLILSSAVLRTTGRAAAGAKKEKDCSATLPLLAVQCLDQLVRLAKSRTALAGLLQEVPLLDEGSAGDPLKGAWGLLVGLAMGNSGRGSGGLMILACRRLGMLDTSERQSAKGLPIGLEWCREGFMLGCLACCSMLCCT